MENRPGGAGRFGTDLPGWRSRGAALRRRHVHGQGGPANRRSAIGQQPGTQENPRQSDLGGTLRLAGRAGHPATSTR